MYENNKYKEIVELIENLEVNTRIREYKDNSDKLITYWSIGKLIVEASNNIRSKYGENILKKWGEKLEKIYGKNYSQRNLELFRQFYNNFPIANALRSQLTWTHYKAILPIKNENERNYYINQVILNNLSSRELIKEIKSDAFNRLSYADKDNIKLIENNNYSLSIKDIIKDPILLNVKENYDKLEEKVLHKLIIELLESRFLELGVGFALIGHEYKIAIEGHVYRLDLLFFNVKLNAYVVIEIKTKKMKVSDVDQLKFYVSLVDKYIKEINHNKTVGLLIVRESDKFVVKYATSEDIFVTKYELKN